MAVDIAIQTDAIKCRGNFLMVRYSILMRCACVLCAFFVVADVVVVIRCKSIIWRSIKFHSFSLVSLWCASHVSNPLAFVYALGVQYVHCNTVNQAVQSRFLRALATKTKTSS